MLSEAVSLLIADDGPAEAILYCGLPEVDPSVLADARTAAAARGFTVVFESVGPDADANKLHEVIEGAKAASITVILVPSRDGLAARSAPDLLARITALTSAGMRVISLSDGYDTSLPVWAAILDGILWAEEARKAGISRGTHSRMKELQAEGRKLGRPPAMPKCMLCGHSVVRPGARHPGHIRLPDGSVGHCLVGTCGCVSYRPRG